MVDEWRGCCIAEGLRVDWYCGGVVGVRLLGISTKHSRAKYKFTNIHLCFPLLKIKNCRLSTRANTTVKIVIKSQLYAHYGFTSKAFWIETRVTSNKHSMDTHVACSMVRPTRHAVNSYLSNWYPIEVDTRLHILIQIRYIRAPKIFYTLK